MPPSTFYQWVKRTRDAMNRKVSGLGDAVIESTDSSQERGYRLSSRYPVLNLQLVREVKRWEQSRRKKRK